MNMMKWKIGVLLVLLMLFLPMIANAEETTKVYSVEELEAYERDGWKISTVMSYTIPEIISERAEVGENVLIEGSAQVYMRKEIKGETLTLSGVVSSYQIWFFVYKNDLQIKGNHGVLTDNKGNYKYTEFNPREPGYYKIVLHGYRGDEWHPIRPNITFAFYVSEKDSDGDGVPDQYDYEPYNPNIQTRSDIEKDSDRDGVLDQYDYDPYDPNIQTKSDIKTPGFDAIFEIIGLSVVAYLLRRRG